MKPPYLDAALRREHYFSAGGAACRERLTQIVH
jgi:hypothetical protein